MKDRIAYEVGGFARTLVGRHDIKPSGREQLLKVHAELLLHREVERDVMVNVEGGAVFLAADTARIDLETLKLMYVWRAFDADCRDRVVLDIGAHKGYFAAWALGRGARAVVSCEPQSQNFKYLELAQQHSSASDRWFLRRVAVGPNEGTARLFVSPDSWAHSLYSDLIVTDSFEDVEMTTLATLVAWADDHYPGVPIVLKVNVEGAAADVCYSATSDQFSSVTEVHLDHEPGSHYDLNELLGYLRSAGLPLVHEQGHNYLLRRTGS